MGRDSGLDEEIYIKYQQVLSENVRLREQNAQLREENSRLRELAGRPVTEVKTPSTGAWVHRPVPTTAGTTDPRPEAKINLFRGLFRVLLCRMPIS